MKFLLIIAITILFASCGNELKNVKIIEEQDSITKILEESDSMIIVKKDSTIINVDSID